MNSEQLVAMVAKAIAAAHSETHNDFALARAAILAILQDHVIISKTEYERINN